MPTFLVHTPVGVNQIHVKRAIREAVAEATRRGKLRPNSVDSLTGKNSGDNLGEETPVIHFEQWEEDEIEVKLILKGGGCENKNIQYSLPCGIGASGPRGPESGRRPQVHPARGVAGAGPGLRAGRGGRVHRQRSRARLRAGEESTLPNSGRRESGAGAGEARSRGHGGGESHRRGRDGFRRQGVADRMQDRGGESAARELLCFGGLRLLGVPTAWACAWMRRAARSRAGCIAIRIRQ